MPNHIEFPKLPFGGLRLVRDEPIASQRALGPATKKRLENQLARAFRNAYGAEQGLRVVVRLATLELLRAGATRADIRQAFTDAVSQHPSGASSRASLLTGESKADALTAMIVRWSDRIDGTTQTD